MSILTTATTNLSKTSIEILKAYEPQLLTKHTASYSSIVTRFGQKDAFLFTEEIYKLSWLKASISPKRKWGEITLDLGKLYADTDVDEEDIHYYLLGRGIEKYTLNDHKSDVVNLTKANGSKKYMGLVRRGLSYGYNNEFKIDRDMLNKYFPIIFNKSVIQFEETFKKYNIELNGSYVESIHEILRGYIDNDLSYTMGGNVSDSRGRGIANNLDKVGNPVGYKTFRSLLVVPEEKQRTLTPDNYRVLNSIYAFITELNGLARSQKTPQGLIDMGKELYEKKSIPDDIDHKIWCERIYTALDEMNSNGSVLWDIPVEVDFSMSMGVIIGLVTGHEGLLDASNVINSNNITDPWKIKGCENRATAKLATAKFYGSSASIDSLAKQSNKEHSASDIKAVKLNMKKGRFGVIDALKTYLIKGSNITEASFKVKLWDDEFEVEVNKFKNAGATPSFYKGMDSDGKVKVYRNMKPVKVPDLSRFRTFLATLFVHNLDSQLIDKIMMYLMSLDLWAIPVHDALLISPFDVADARKGAEIHMVDLYNRRKEVFSDFTESIGCTSEGYLTPKSKPYFLKFKKALGTNKRVASEISGLCLQ